MLLWRYTAARPPSLSSVQTTSITPSQNICQYSSFVPLTDTDLMPFADGEFDLVPNRYVTAVARTSKTGYSVDGRPRSSTAGWARSREALYAMSEKKRWDIALVGAGNNAKVHAEGLLRHPDRATLVAVVEPDPKRRSAFAEQYNLDRSYGTVQEMVDDTPPETAAAIVSTPTNVRLEVCRLLFAARIPVLIEKPMCDNLADALVLTSLAAECRCPFSVNQNFRYCFPYRKAHELLKRGEIGRPLHLVQHAMSYRDNTGWRAGQSRNVMAVMSIHWLDGLRYLLDDEPQSVHCLAVDSPAVKGTNDSAISLIAVMRQGTLVSLSESFSSFTASGWGNTYCQLDCERGGMTLGMDGMLRVVRHGQEPQDIGNTAVDKPESDFLVLEEFLRAIELGTDAPTSAIDNLKSVRFLEAAYRSAGSGEVVSIDDLPLPGVEPCVLAKPGQGVQSVRPRRWGIYHKEPGQEHSKVHFHDCDEWYVILEGTGRVKIGDVEKDVESMDLVHVPAGFLHGTLRSQGTYKLLFMEGALQGRRRAGHLHVGVDEPFADRPSYLPNRPDAHDAS